MFLEYLALGLLLLIVTGLFYVFMYIHDIPYELAEKRHHPQKDAIYWGCWLSLFTLHVLWPFIFLWAVSKPARVEVTGGESSDDDSDAPSAAGEIKQLREQVTALQSRIAAMEQRREEASVTDD
jgi:hypothetical protein